MTYRIVSDISADLTNNRVSFCVKVVNGVTLTYRGTFKWGNVKNCHDFEVRASYVGLCLIAQHLEENDTVLIHSDVYSQFNSLVRKSKFRYFKDLMTTLRRRRVQITIKAIDGNSRPLYNQCHSASRARNKKCENILHTQAQHIKPLLYL